MGDKLDPAPPSMCHCRPYRSCTYSALDGAMVFEPLTSDQGAVIVRMKRRTFTTAHLLGRRRNATTTRTLVHGARQDASRRCEPQRRTATLAHGPWTAAKDTAVCLVLCRCALSQNCVGGVWVRSLLDITLPDVYARPLVFTTLARDWQPQGRLGSRGTSSK